MAVDPLPRQDAARVALYLLQPPVPDRPPARRRGRGRTGSTLWLGHPRTRRWCATNRAGVRLRSRLVKTSRRSGCHVSGLPLADYRRSSPVRAAQETIAVAARTKLDKVPPYSPFISGKCNWVSRAALA